MPASPDGAPPTVSVALCTYNGAPYVRQQLVSILAQTVPPAEVIVSDDGSTDRTVELVRAVWERQRPPGTTLRLLVNETPLGVVRNFEQAMGACAGEVIALSDQDDMWRPDKLELMLAQFGARPDLGVLFTDARLVDDDGQPFGSLFAALEISSADLAAFGSGAAFGTLLRRNLATGATMLLRRSLLDAARPFPAIWVHDEWLAILAAATSTIDWLPERLIDYRQHSRNQIGAAKPTLRRKISKVLEPRADRYELLAARADVLVERLDELGADPAVIELARRKAAHERFRAALPASRPRRVRAVLAADRAGDYAAFSSRGRADVLRDLLQPQ